MLGAGKDRTTKRRNAIFENIFSLDFFKLSGIVRVHTASYWLRNTASKFNGEILRKSRYLM